MSSVKLVVVGPTKSGKSSIADFVAELSPSLGREVYDPTVGVRILEYARGGANVELWDVSGNRRFDAGWAAIQKDAAGVIIVFDGDDGDQERAVALWHGWFVKSQGLDDRQCLIMSHTGGIQPQHPPFPDELRRVKVVSTCYEAPAAVRKEVDAFVASLRSFAK